MSGTNVVSILVLLFSHLLFHTLCAGQAQNRLSTKVNASSLLVFHQEWYSLGPFRIGTREAVWGADPLEVVGGFADIPCDEHTQFKSSLTPNASVKWTRHVLNVDESDCESSVHFDIGYDQVDWTFHQQVYGWPGLQFQSWTRGVLYNSGTETLKAWVYPQGILELYVNADHFFGGDFFTFNKAPVLVDLEPGPNVFNVRLVRDVRAMGGTNPPLIDAKLHVKLAGTAPEIDYSQIISPNVVDGKLPSRYLSFPVRNPLANWISVTDCGQSHFTLLGSPTVLSIAPGQIRPIGLVIADGWQVSTTFTGAICYIVENGRPFLLPQQLHFSVPLKYSGLIDANKFTFLHQSGAVSYAVLKPPTVWTNRSTMPLLLELHGAGVEADSDQLKHSLDGVLNLETFALFPTGMSMWSGDDWHIWGTADALSAIEAVHDWMDSMNWNGTQATTQQIVVAGHSNGGQGTWFFATHHPDLTLAAAPASGYTSVETYVPFSMWNEAEPLQSSILHNARSNYRHELLVENLAAMMVMQQHGSADDNVPVYHSRLMSSLRFDAGLSSDYAEIGGKPHWWEGAMTTEPMQQFYRESLSLGDRRSFPVTKNFTIVIPGCGHIGSKFGIVVDQLKSPDRSGRIKVSVVEEGGQQHWRLETTNIHRLRLDSENLPNKRPSHLLIDSDPRSWLWEDMAFDKSCFRKSDKEWHCSKADWKKIDQRYGRQRGALDAILQTRGTFQIVSCLEKIDLAVQLSRNFFQYYGADAAILPCELYELVLEGSGNVILLANDTGVIQARLDDYPITIARKALSLRTFRRELITIDSKPGMGAVFLRPLHGERLELVVWGADAAGLRHAARLVPTITGAGQPDFVVFGSDMRHNGHKGALAMGFFDYSWNISRASYLP